MEKMSKIMDIMGTQSAQELKHLCDVKSTSLLSGPSFSSLAQNRQDTTDHSRPKTQETTVFPYY